MKITDINKYREIKNMNGYDDLEKFYSNQIELLLQKQSNIQCTVLIWNQTDVLTETINRKTTYDKKDKDLLENGFCTTVLKQTLFIDKSFNQPYFILIIDS